LSTRLLLASDVRLYREGLECILRGIDGIELVATATGFDEAVERARELTPCVALLDMRMPRAFSLARQLARVAEATRVVALGMPEDEVEVVNCAEIGIAGYVPRDGSASDLIASIESAARGELRCSPKIAGVLFRKIAALSRQRSNGSHDTALTAREAQILRLLQQGLSNKLISSHLGIGLPTVKNHVHSVLAKLGLQRRAQVASLGWRQGAD
jgi:DNA-binding NarL/FixJ family response regulator